VKAAIEAQLARARGFATEMIFVATDSIDENVARIVQRARRDASQLSDGFHEAFGASSLIPRGDMVYGRPNSILRTASWPPSSPPTTNEMPSLKSGPDTEK
jgi:hypothetical protein